MELVWWALYFKRHFISKIIFLLDFLWLFMFTENWNKTGKITAKIVLFFFLFFFIVTVCILSVSFNFFPWSRVKKIKIATAISNRNTCRIKILKKNHNTYRIGTQVSWSGGRCIVPSLVDIGFSIAILKTPSLYDDLMSTQMAGTQQRMAKNVNLGKIWHHIIYMYLRYMTNY